MRRSKRTGWVLIPAGLIGLSAVLILGLWAYDRWANDVPPFLPPLVAMPSPNGYTQAAALTARLLPEPVSSLPRWPDGTPEQLRAVLHPISSTLAAIRATFRLPWQAPPPLGLLAPHQRHVWIRSGRYFIAASRLAQQEGNAATALQCSFDGIELAARASRGAPLLTGMEAVAIEADAFRRAEELVPVLPAGATADALKRVRRLRRLWPTYPEILEAERIYTLADATWTFRQPYQHPTPLHTLRFVGELGRDAFHEPISDTKENLLIWLEPKRYALRKMDRYMRQIIGESKKPSSLRRAVPLPGDLLSRLCTPGFWMSPAWLWREQTDLELLEAALAVRLYRLQHGRYPARLADISPRYLPAIPLQPWGQPIAYELRDEKPMISCLGPSGRGKRVFGRPLDTY